MTRVLIVGAGPVGLFAALKLVQHGISVDVFEKENRQHDSPRAAGYYGPVLDLYKDAGIFDAIKEEGFIEGGLSFRTLPVDDGKGGKTFGREIGCLHDPQVLLPQPQLASLFARHALATGKANIHYGKEAIAIDQRDNDVNLTVKDFESGKTETVCGDYLIGTDGGKSTVRSLLGIRFPGHTWPERMIATNVIRLNGKKLPVSAHFMVDAANWCICIPLSPPIEGQKSLWRYGIGIDSKDHRTDDELVRQETLAELYEKLMVGPRPLQYEVVQKTVYHTHQRLASTFRRGRCLLAGDAAHLCNPVGAMGLSTGLLDAEALTDALSMIINEGYPESLLTVYSDVRREVFGFFVDPMTTQNKLRLSNPPEDVERDDNFMRMLNNPAIDSVAEFTKLCNERWRTDMRSKVASYGIKPTKAKSLQ